MSSARPVLAAFSQRLRALRIAAQLNQLELARRSNIQVAFVRRIEHGRGNPSLATIALLAVGLECDVSDFFKSPTSDGSLLG
jgi:transcriptional regulator with XRE-family HTH domain